MPDLITHVTAAYFVSRRQSFQRYRVIFYMGTILPDLLARPIHILFPKLYLYTIAIHTPVFMAILTLVFCELFQPVVRRTVAKFFSAGIALHFLLDLLQKHLADGYYWLFPFSWISFEIGLFWPETAVSLIPLWCLLVICTEIFLRLRKSSIHRERSAL